MTKVRTRMAPSPSSGEKSLHLGNCRVALASYLVAKKAGGDFILRIEDSDVERNVKGCEQGMLDDLNWLGISPTEGWGTNNKPCGKYSQLERQHRYTAMAEDLLSRGLAYKCICDEKSLNDKREEALKRNPKAPFKYPGTCRNLNLNPDKDYVIRFKAPLDGETIHNDEVFGRIVYPHVENYDWVIMRSNGRALYNFANCIDDIDMEITHIIRGRDHSGFNTLQQMLFYKAFGANVPKLAHLPLVLNASGAKLAKRDGAVSVKQVKAAGYSPSAILSYLSRLAWGHGNKELFTHNELIELFDLKDCGKNDTRFDFAKFAATNATFLKSQELVSDQSYAQHLSPFLSSLGHNLTTEQIIPLIPLTRTRSKTFVEAANELDPILRNEIAIDQAAKEKLITEQVKRYLTIYNNLLNTITTWNEDNIRAATNWWLTSNNLILKDIGQPVRLAVVGRTNSPELFQTMAAIGKDTVMKRIANILA